MSALVRFAAFQPADRGPRAARLSLPGSRIGGPVAARKQKRMSARTVEDEDCQLRYERVAGIDVAKGPAMVCLRLPPGPGKTRRTSRTWEVTARVPDIGALAAGLDASRVERVPVESASGCWRTWFVVLEAAGLEVQLVNS